MLTFKNALLPNGTRHTLTVASAEDHIIDANALTALPGLIDPHVHFRTPGLEHKENWCSAALAAIRGGYTTVFDMPNTIPPTMTAELLADKKRLIDSQLQQADIPLHYQLFFGADKNHFSEIHKVKDQVIGIKVFMGCSTGNLVIDDDESLHAIFAIAASLDLLVAVHAEDEQLLKARKQQFTANLTYASHSHIRNTEVAVRAVEKAIALTRIYGTKLYILHTSTAAELALIHAAKQAGLPVFAETTPHHLFLDTDNYAALGGKAVVNPPLRTQTDRDALFAAIRDGVIDTIGSDHAPHTIDEKSQAYGSCPSGMPGIETTLPLLLTACHAGLLTLTDVIRLTHDNPQKIFNLTPHEDLVFVDTHTLRSVDELQLATKCRWSAFAGRELRGWPVYVVLAGKLYHFS